MCSIYSDFATYSVKLTVVINDKCHFYHYFATYLVTTALTANGIFLHHANIRHGTYFFRGNFYKV